MTRKRAGILALAALAVALLIVLFGVLPRTADDSVEEAVETAAPPSATAPETGGQARPAASADQSPRADDTAAVEEPDAPKAAEPDIAADAGNPPVADAGQAGTAPLGDPPQAPQAGQDGGDGGEQPGEPQVTADAASDEQPADGRTPDEPDSVVDQQDVSAPDTATDRTGETTAEAGEAETASQGEEPPAAGDDDVDRAVRPDEADAGEEPTAVTDIGDAEPVGEVTAKSVVPSFDLLRVEPDGSTVIAGRAAPGASIEIVDGESVVATAEAGPSGDFAAVLDTPLSAGDHQLVIRSHPQGAGDAVVSEEVATVSVPDEEENADQLLAMVTRPGQASRIINQPAQRSAAAVPADDPAPDTARPAGDPPPTASDMAPADQPTELGAGGPAVDDAAEDPATVEIDLPDLPAGAAELTGRAPEIAALPPTAGRAGRLAEPLPDGDALPEDGTAAAGADGAATPESDAVPAPPRQELRIDAVEIENDRLFIAGQAPPGAVLRVYAGEVLVEETRVGPGGRFVVDDEVVLTVGRHDIRADMIDPQTGGVVLRAMVPFIRPAGDQIAAVARPPDASTGPATAPRQAGSPPAEGEAGAGEGDGVVPGASAPETASPETSTPAEDEASTAPMPKTAQTDPAADAPGTGPSALRQRQAEAPAEEADNRNGAVDSDPRIGDSQARPGDDGMTASAPEPQRPAVPSAPQRQAADVAATDAAPAADRAADAETSSEAPAVAEVSPPKEASRPAEAVGQIAPPEPDKPPQLETSDAAADAPDAAPGAGATTGPEASSEVPATAEVPSPQEFASSAEDVEQAASTEPAASARPSEPRSADAGTTPVEDAVPEPETEPRTQQRLASSERVAPPEDSAANAPPIVGGDLQAGVSLLSPPTIIQPALTATDGSVIIRRGDTLWQISRRVYGRGVRYTTIYLANSDQITNPDLILPGQVFDVPQEPLDNAEQLHRRRLSGERIAPNR